ncbi:DUF58 domain-containing protein [Cytobacillus oceanisediminis]|uniref:DUF58 domain-containing protein n=1 Tax=Cytobacillus oceanisediminis TaxID=665099 RepID=UPI00203FC2DA|nr:DUF58 domain-containing protein [Cytobacillus oceanisediminis]MCM3404850.1 DUF58 domain-containing protein [Cytobacillus oceanisediminis]MDK7669042.1 DUF58 domain-containing protein [Cytobacillus oceanisediminis]
MKQLLKAMKDVWKLIVLFLLILFAFSYAMFQGGFVSWFLFYSFLPFALYALGLSFYSLNDFKVERILPKTEFNAGEQAVITLRITRRTAFPLLYLIIEDEMSEQLQHARKSNEAKRFLFPGFQKEMSLQYRINSLPRGEHFFASIRVKTGDLLGLIEKERQAPAKSRMIVYPAYEEIIYKPMAHHYDQGMTASKERVQRDTSMAIGIREYQPGDRFSWINWKATAKRNDIMTKEFEQRQSHDVYILMDCAPDSRFEAIVSFTASIARAILRKGAQTGFLTSAETRTAFPIRGGEAHQLQLFYHLAKIKDDSQAAVDRVLEAEHFLLQQNSQLMVITAQLTKALIEKASFFTSKKGIVTIFLMKNEDEAPSRDELLLKTSANARGIRVVLVHNGQFADVFSGVSK